MLPEQGVQTRNLVHIWRPWEGYSVLLDVLTGAGSLLPGQRGHLCPGLLRAQSLCSEVLLRFLMVPCENPQDGVEGVLSPNVCCRSLFTPCLWVSLGDQLGSTEQKSLGWRSCELSDTESGPLQALLERSMSLGADIQCPCARTLPPTENFPSVFICARRIPPCFLAQCCSRGFWVLSLLSRLPVLSPCMGKTSRMVPLSDSPLHV